MVSPCLVAVADTDDVGLFAGVGAVHSVASEPCLHFGGSRRGQDIATPRAAQHALHQKVASTIGAAISTPTSPDKRIRNLLKCFPDAEQCMCRLDFFKSKLLPKYLLERLVGAIVALRSVEKMLVVRDMADIHAGNPILLLSLDKKPGASAHRRSAMKAVHTPRDGCCNYCKRGWPRFFLRH